MDFDLNIFGSMIIPTITASCLILGYIVKKWINDVDNKWIPTLLAVFGAVLACVSAGEFSVITVTSGAFSGLAGTGLHQAFKQIIGDKQ